MLSESPRGSQITDLTSKPNKRIHQIVYGEKSDRHSAGGGGGLRPFDLIFKTHFLIQKLTVGGFCSSRRLSAIHSFLVKTPLTFSIKLSNHRAPPSCTTHNLKINNVVPFARRSRRDVSQARPDCRHTVIALPLRPRGNCRRDIIAQMSRKG